MKPLLLRFWLRTAVHFLLRSGRSTAILLLMVLLSVGTLIFLSSLAVGVNDAMVRNSVSLYSGHVSGVGLPSGLASEDLRIEGVSSVLKRRLSPGLLRHRDRFEGVTVVAGDPGDERRSTALWRKITEGTYPASGERAILLSRFLADRLELQVGDEVEYRLRPEAEATLLRVSGIFRTGVEQLDRGVVFCPPDVVPTVSDTWTAAVFLREGVDPEEVAGRYREKHRAPVRFETWAEMMPDLRQLIDLNYVSMTLVTVIVFGIVALGVSCAFVIFILKNVREYGIVKAMGVTPLETTALIAVEVVLLNVAASCLGVLLGVAVVYLFRRTGIDLTSLTSQNRYFAVSGVVIPRLTGYSLWVPPGVALAFSLVASVWPVALVVRSRTADLLRSV